MDLVKEICHTLDNNSFLCVLKCELCKAFDCLASDILKTKLIKHYVNAASINLILAFLIGRSQLVNLNDRENSYLPIDLDAPQVSVLDDNSYWMQMILIL